MTTRHTRRNAIWEHAKTEILEVEDADPLGLYIIQNRINTPAQLLGMSQDVIDNMQYNDGTADAPVPQGHRLRIRILQSFYSHICFLAGDQVDWADLTGDEYDEFSIVSYDPNAELIRYGTAIEK